jgi:hypothetical protein
MVLLVLPENGADCGHPSSKFSPHAGPQANVLAVSTSAHLDGICTPHPHPHLLRSAFLHSALH